MRFIGNNRSQWQSVQVPYRIFSGSFDSKLFHKMPGKTGNLGRGFMFNNETAGDAGLSLPQFGPNIAYTKQVSGPVLITIFL